MHSIRLAVGVLGTLFTVACINLPDIEPSPPPSEEADGGLPDGGTSSPPDAGTPDGGEHVPTVIVIESPAATVFTKDTVEVRINVSGAPAESIELLANNSLLSTLSSPFTYTWDTQGMPEGSYSLQARATGTPAPVVSEPRTVVVDRTPPQLTLRKPDPGATNVSVKAAIQAQFSEPLESASITDSTVTLLAGSTQLAKTLSLSPDGRTLTIAPASTPPVPNQLSVTFSTEVGDLANNSLIAPSTTWSWALPDWLLLANGLGSASAARPSLVLDNSSNPVVAWAESDSYAQALGPMGWADLGGTLSVNPGSTPSTTPSIQVKSSGSPVIAWAEPDGVAQNIYVREWVTDRWQTVGSGISAYPGSTAASFPSLGLKQDGSPVVAWSESDGTVENVLVQQWSNGSWQAIGVPLSAAGGNTNARYPKMVLDSTGSPVVAWHESDGTAVNLYVSRWAGATWQTVGGALSAYTGATDVRDSSIAIDQSDNPVVAWTEASSNGYAVHVRRWTGSTWQFAVDVLSSGQSPYFTDGLTLKLTAQGQPIIAWVEHSDNGQGPQIQLHMWRFVLGGWQYMATFGNGAPSAPSLALDAAGVPTLAWSDNGPYDRNIFVVRQNR